MAYLVVLAVQRGHELALSARHERALRARGAIECGRRLRAALVLLHATYPLALAAEVWLFGTHPPAAWPAALAVLVLAAALRAWSMAALGPLWTTRIMITPGASLVRSGPYRWLAHPSYLAAALEVAAAPLLFGAWRTALAFSTLNLPLLVARARQETRALSGSAEHAV